MMLFCATNYAMAAWVTGEVIFGDMKLNYEKLFFMIHFYDKVVLTAALA